MRGITTAKRIAAVLPAAALAVIAASGCEPADGQRGVRADCDASGWGPLSGCTMADNGTAESADEWIIDSFGYRGPRGGGTHYLICVPSESDLSDGTFREVPGYPDNGLLSEGDPCPPGGTIYSDGSVYEDGAW
jgi:hypothetical protein